MSEAIMFSDDSNKYMEVYDKVTKHGFNKNHKCKKLKVEIYPLTNKLKDLNKTETKYQTIYDT